jgi:quercetin dioxygenase-like cupin family protein
MQKISLEALGRQQSRWRRPRAAAARPTRCTAAEKVLRQTVIGMTASAVLAEHENPGEATVQVLFARPHVGWGSVVEGRTGDLLIVPDSRHSLLALEDSAILLTVAKSAEFSACGARRSDAVASRR